jgi:hypothetical protein
VWRLKYLIIGMIAPALLGVALYFLAPAMADALRDTVRESAQDTVRNTFEDDLPATVTPGQIVITESQLEDAVGDALNDRWDIDELTVEIKDGRVSILSSDRDGSTDDPTIASAVPEIQDGRFVLTDRRGLLSIFKPARDAIADEIQEQVERLFQNSNVRPVSVTANNRRLVIVTQLVADGATTPASTTRSPTPQLTPTPRTLRTPTP